MLNKDVNTLLLYFIRLLDEEEAVEEFDDKDEDQDGKLSWKDYLQAHFSYSEDEIKEMRKTDRDDVLQFLVVCNFSVTKEEAFSNHTENIV